MADRYELEKQFDSTGTFTYEAKQGTAMPFAVVAANMQEVDVGNGRTVLVGEGYLELDLDVLHEFHATRALPVRIVYQHEDDIGETDHIGTATVRFSEFDNSEDDQLFLRYEAVFLLSPKHFKELSQNWRKLSLCRTHFMVYMQSEPPKGLRSVLRYIELGLVPKHKVPGFLNLIETRPMQAVSMVDATPLRTSLKKYRLTEPMPTVAPAAAPQEKKGVGGWFRKG